MRWIRRLVFENARARTPKVGVWISEVAGGGARFLWELWRALYAAAAEGARERRGDIILTLLATVVALVLGVGRIASARSGRIRARLAGWAEALN